MLNLDGNPASLHKNIPAERVFTKAIIRGFEVESVEWLMSIKPSIRKVTRI